MDGFNDLMAEFGKILGIEGFAPDAEGVCILQSEEAEIRIIHCPEADDTLLLSAVVMSLPKDGGRSLLAALGANHRFLATGGATASMDPESEELVLSQYLPLAVLAPRSLVALVEKFSSALIALRSLGAGDQTPPDVETDGLSVLADTVEIDGVSIELGEGDEGQVLAVADLGEAPDALVVARDMMVANHLFCGTAGATLSLDAATGHVFLQQNLYPVDEEDWLARRLAVFADKAGEWRGRISGQGAPQGDRLPFSGNYMPV